MAMKKKTISTIFFAPTIINVEAAENNGFQNCFIKDRGSETDYPDSVYLLFKPSNMDKFKDFLDHEYERGSSIIEDYDYPDGFIVLVYQLNMEFRKDFALIKKGQYSKTSLEFQELFPKTKKVLEDKKWINTMSVQHRIFNKTEDLIEYWEEKLGIRFQRDMVR